MAQVLSIPFGKPDFSEEEIAAVSEVLRRGWVGMGPETLAFESELAAWLGCGQLVSVSSCTGALFLSLLVSGVAPGDEVICPSLTWCSTANAALYLGARPVFCDVDAHTMSLTPETVLPHVTERTRAVMVVHYGGLAVDVAALRRRLPDHVTIIEDAAHALGARYPDGRRVGASGNLVCFSFYANKNLSTGEGGAIALADGAVAERLRSLRQHGLHSSAWGRYSNPRTPLAGMVLSELGYKLNYTDLQAAIARVQLRRQPEFASRRLAIARYYLDRLHDLSPEGWCQAGLGEDSHAHHLFAVRLPVERMRVGRDDIVAAERATGIGFSIHYAPLHLMPLYRHDGVLPQTEQLNQALLTLPIGAAMTLEDAMLCLDRLRSYL